MNRASQDPEVDPRTVAWILYSVAMASGSALAPLTDVATAADAINHAVPTQQEMHGSLRRLQALRLVEAQGRFLGLTDAGQALVSNARDTAGTVSKVWATLTLAVGQLSNPA